MSAHNPHTRARTQTGAEEGGDGREGQGGGKGLSTAAARPREAR